MRVLQNDRIVLEAALEECVRDDAAATEEEVNISWVLNFQLTDRITRFTQHLNIVHPSTLSQKPKLGYNPR